MDTTFVAWRRIEAGREPADTVIVMPSGISPRRLAGTRLSLSLALIFALTPGAAWAAASRPSDGDLSARLAELAKPAVASAPPAAQATALSLPVSGPGSMVREGNRVLVEVRFDHGAASATGDLRAVGAEVLNVSPQYQRSTVAMKPEQLAALSGIPGVADVSPVLAPIVASACPSGEVVSEGDLQLHAQEAREAPATPDGSGVTVGILSDSFNGASKAADGSGHAIATKQADDVASGDLPGTANPCAQLTPVAKLDDTDASGGDEGRAMAQIVHDLAPGADLAFATAFTSETAFAANIEKLAAPLPAGAGAAVIADDVSYPTEPFFQEGVVGNAVRKVTEDGASYFSSAANNNLIADGKDIASWEAPEFRDSGGCPSAIVEFSDQLEAEGKSGLHPTHCMDFSPGPAVDPTFRITVSPGATLRIDLQWAEPWEEVGTDLDAFLLGPGGELVELSAEDNVFGTQEPFEFVPWKNNTGSPANVRLVINRYSGDDPRLKFALLQNGGGVSSTEYESSQGGDVVGPTIFGHNGGEATTSVAAIAFDATEAPEPYSSRGPVTHLFGPVNGTTPALPIPEEVLPKPDITATDCNETTFFAFEDEGAWRFCGTSAAAPHAAAVAALMLEEKPTATPAEIRLALQEAATPIGALGAFGPCAIGSGLVEAVGAIAALLSSGGGTPAACTPPESGAVTEEGESEGVSIPVAPVTEIPSGETPPRIPIPAPQTRFARHPAKVLRTRERSVIAVFRFAADETGASFICRIDRGPFHSCAPRLRRRFTLGFHVVRVFARNADGAVDATPAAFRFRVVRIPD